MSSLVSRRAFIRESLATTAVTALGLGGPSVSAAAERADSKVGKNGMPMGQIGKLKVSWLISGGNLISGWAHARDLMYVQHLMRNYNTPEKVIQTLEILEENGVNAIIADPRKKPMDIFKEHWRNGGKIQWIAEGHPEPEDLKGNIQKSIDWGASAVYIQGVIGDRWLKAGQIDLLGKCVDFIKSHGVPGGIGAHNLDVIVHSEAREFNPDFYVKTLHHNNYWSARRSDQTADVIDNNADNYWSVDPEKTIEFMKQVERPWIAFKVLAAGAIHPSSGFKYAFENGADFICVGMFDFQVVEDVLITKEILKGLSSRRRPWRA